MRPNIVQTGRKGRGEKLSPKHSRPPHQKIMNKEHLPVLLDRLYSTGLYYWVVAALLYVSIAQQAGKSLLNIVLQATPSINDVFIAGPAK